MHRRFNCRNLFTGNAFFILHNKILNQCAGSLEKILLFSLADNEPRHFAILHQKYFQNNNSAKAQYEWNDKK